MHAGTQHDQPFRYRQFPVIVVSLVSRKFEYLFVIALRLFRRAFHEIRKHGDEFM